MCTKNNGVNAKLRISCFISQRQRIQPNFLNHKYQTTKYTNTMRTTTLTTSMWVSPITQSLCSYNWDNANSGVFIFKFRNKVTNFVHFIHHQFFTDHQSRKTCTLLDDQFRTFIHSYMNPLPLTLFRMGGKKPPTILFPITSTNVGISPQIFLTFIFNPFASKIIELEPRPLLKKAVFLVKSL